MAQSDRAASAQPSKSIRPQLNSESASFWGHASPWLLPIATVCILASILLLAPFAGWRVDPVYAAVLAAVVVSAGGALLAVRRFELFILVLLATRP